MAEQLDYLYSGISNDKMLEGAETIHDLYVVDVATFTAFDASLDASVATDLLEAIDLARDYPTDELVVDEISELTVAVDEAWGNCRRHFQDAKYFIEKAFPGNNAIQKSFGYDDYQTMSRYQDKVLTFMDTFHDKADKHKVVLIAAGYTQAKIDQIETLATAFRTANRNQEKAKKDRLETTQNRAKTFNNVWVILQQINRASKSVYRDDYAKLQQYLLPAPGSNEAPEDLAATGVVSNSVTNAPIADAIVELPDLGLTATADDAGKYGFVTGTPAGTTPITAKANGFNEFASTITIVDGETVTKNLTMVPV